MRKAAKAMAVLSLMAGTAHAGTPTTWITNYSGAYSNTTIKFNDWGYEGPTGVGANDYQVGTGFDSSRIGQIQHVVTTGPDWKTPDPGHTVLQDFNEQNPPYNNANMDSAVNFYKWGYTTVAGSVFNNMQIDKAGNYHIAKNDMSFQFYDRFQYRDTTEVNPDATYDTNINFQPYALSDAKGWCGSVLSANPNNLEKMAGQVTFDFAFDAYVDNSFQGSAPGVTGQNQNFNIQIVPGFVMRSYGNYEVYYEEDGYSTTYYGSAVINNTNPLTGLVDPAYQNRVSFLGAGVVPTGAWIKINQVRADGTWDYSVAEVQGADGSAEGQLREDGAVWHGNAFAGFAFMLRADGMRILDYVNPTGFSDYTVVPVPAGIWLLGSGLLGLLGAVRRRPAGLV